MAEEKVDRKKLADKIKQRFLAGVAYKRSQEFYDKWNEYERFWESDQWPEVTPGTETLPRPVTNHFASIIERKISALLTETPEIYFEPKDCDPETTDADEAADLLTKVAKRQAENLGGNDEDVTLEELLEEGARSAALFGTGLWYFAWDNSITGGISGISAYVGDIVGREIDPTNFFPGNPSDPYMQTQPWIILAERRPLQEVKDFYRQYAPDVVDLLQPERSMSDTQVYEHEKIEQEMVDPVNVIHCWWKETDEETGEKKLNYAVECQGHLLRYEEGLYKHGLYPFVAFLWYPRKKSFWGKPESADLISNQKEINRMDAIMLLSAYTTGMPHIRYKDQFVDARDITNDPGTLIKDNAPLGGWAIDYLKPPPMPAYPAAMRDKLTAEMKDVAGAHEAWSGKAPSADLNASAIIALQEAAGIPMRNIQKRFYRALREIGVLWLAFWKEFYTEARLIRITGPDNQIGYVWFRGTDFADMRFDVKVKAGTASPYSRALLMANLDKMLERQVINQEEYLEMLPADVFPKAQQILQKRQQAQQQAAEMQQFMQMMAQQQGGQVAPGMQPSAPFNPEILGAPVSNLVR
jgi:hypothetical protein